MTILAMNGIHRSYERSREALKGIDLSVEAGEVVGLIGRNGAGKTSLLRIAVGILQAHKGNVRVFGKDPWEHAVEVKRRIGYVAESQVLPAHITVQGLIDLHKDLYPTWDEALERDLRVRLGVRESSRISALSKGEARKVILLCAIAHRPELLILDEPAGGLDPSARREFLQVSIELLSAGGSTILFSSHHMADVERIASRVAVIEEGDKLLDVDLSEFRQNYCLAILPALSQSQLERARATDGFVRSRKRGDVHYAVFSRPAEEVQDELSSGLEIPDARCTQTSLEEMFIALVGAES